MVHLGIDPALVEVLESEHQAMARALEPEWLDTLPPDDPRAVRSRADLRRVNALMGNARIVADLLRGAPRPLRRVAELGAGDGTFALRVVRALGPAPRGPGSPSSIARPW